ncbi:sensor histidine kinase [Saccharopolyspora erythraea]|uniref:sensor histidine kinase n=1 Tax=Saccharopolyspora erythraea TaxID=1836 RepID=UPI0001D30C7C|nr:sensor histidine kinase [Saccharopolyspora erythraea]EQD83093.1 histidine kinase [Saccharopolyspora erythraea D]QRK88333.1 sensor histidine kinase [Saccharopolyspora erythraea]
MEEVRGSLSRQLLVWQLLIIFVLLASIAVFSVTQSDAAFRATEGRRMLSVAEDLAATEGVRVSLPDPFRHDVLPILAESARSLSGADHVIIADGRGIVLTSPDPGQRGQRLPTGASTALSGRAWVGEIDTDGVDSLVAQVPVISADARIIGVVSAGRETPDVLQGLREAPQNPLTLLTFATVLGIAGSVLLARRVKRQTLGLEPQEITRLVEHREALLHGIREGVLGVDQQNRITLVNDQARALLSLPEDCVGRPIDELGLNERAADVLTGRADGVDQIVLRRGRVVVLNRMPISSVGAVVTMRDRTELVDLRRELDAHRDVTDTLRAQAHEFTNRLHTISGLIELGEYEELQRYVDRVSHTREQWHAEVGARVGDPATAALLIAKASLAAERGVGLRLHEGAALGEIDEQLSADLVTVLGNLVDNALDALEGSPGSTRDFVEVDLRHDDEVTVVVRDSGPGVAPEIAEEVFRHGFTTKAARGGERGLGLALTRQICRRRGGSVQVRNDRGAVFTARLPIGPAPGGTS